MKQSLIAKLIAFALLLVGADAAQGAYPGANGKIAFNSARGCPAYLGCGSGSLYTIEPDGSSETQLPQGGSDAAWSPDGRKLAFTAVDPTFHSLVIAVVDADGTGRRELDPPRLPNTADLQPAWSPDSRKIAFTRFVPSAGPFGRYELFAMTADGQDATRLTFSDATPGTLHSTEPAWSPDGKKIAFTRVVHSDKVITDSEIFVMNPDGSDVTRLTYNDTSYVQPTDAFPTWSPDGSRIAFSRFDQGYDVYTMRPDGTDVKRITNPGNDLYPAWSPDGTRIAVANQRAEYPGYEIVVYGADGSGETKLTNSGGSSSFDPDWQPLDRPPNCSSVSATPSSLWPPNGRFVTVTLGGASDPDGDPVSITATGIASDEQANGDFALGPAADQARLRAKREGAGDGRVYTLAFEASDGRGGQCTGTATVTVPHSR